MKNKDGKGREYLNTALRAGEDKLLHNTSRGEQALCWVTVLLALMSLVMSAVTAIGGGDAMTIARAFTEKPVLFVLIVLLTVYDRVFLLRGRSLTVIVFCLLSIARGVFGVMEADGFAVVLAVLSLLAGTAFYGTIFVDQLRPSDRRLKYRIIYGGALVKILVILISIISQGSGLAEAGTAEVLAVMAHGLTEIFVPALMVYHFDSGFGYLKFILNEVTAPSEPEVSETPEMSEVPEVSEASEDDEDDDEPAPHRVPIVPVSADVFEAEGTADMPVAFEDYEEFEEPEKLEEPDVFAAYVAYKEPEKPKTPEASKPHDDPEEEYIPCSELEEFARSVDSTDDTEDTAPDVAPADEPAPAEPDEEVLDDFGYVPYDDDTPDASVDSSVRPVMSGEDSGAAAPHVFDDDDDDEPMTVVEEDGVLIDESVIEYERAQRRLKQAEAEDAKAAETVEGAENDENAENTDNSAPSPQPAGRAQQLWAQLTPIEQQYVAFGLAHRKPADTLQVEGLSGDLFDVWVDNDTICFQNDLDQASGGRGVRTAAIPFDAVQNIGLRDLDGEECIVLTYTRDSATVEIGFTRASFANFRRVMLG